VIPEAERPSPPAEESTRPSPDGGPEVPRAAEHGVADYRYWGFISYSHADDEWAKWLHRAIERYQVPRRLWGRPSPSGPLPRRLFPVFRDRDELPSASDLGARLQESLRSSRYLIVISSARSAVSCWVNEEIRTFKSWGREGQVFALVVDGEPNASDRPQCGALECFAPALRFRIAEDGTLTNERIEMIAADA
jgi:hypothetical protein